MTDMSRVSLSLLKAQTRTTSFDRDDEYLQHLLDAAEAQVIAMTGYTADEWAVVPDADFPQDLAQAILMRAASFYAYREDVDNASLAAVPNTLAALVKPWQKMRGGSLAESLMEKWANYTAITTSDGQVLMVKK